jgi:hypothetical protein
MNDERMNTVLRLQAAVFLKHVHISDYVTSVPLSLNELSYLFMCSKRRIK